jgi:hypothetical protein
MAPTVFSKFNRVVVGTGAAFTAAGGEAVAKSQVLIAQGALTIAGTLANAGLADAITGGALTITGAVANAGLLQVGGGVMTVEGAVSGAGTVRILSGTADFASGFSQNVAFTGSTGVLELGKSQTYAGAVSGLAKTGGSQLDLRDIAYSGSTKASFAGTAASGTLTVTDGTHTAKITLTGDYTASAFTVAPDGHGGTLVKDPPGAHAVAAFADAMAGLGPSAGAGTAPGILPEAWRAATMLVPGRGAIA